MPNTPIKVGKLQSCDIFLNPTCGGGGFGIRYLKWPIGVSEEVELRHGIGWTAKVGEI